MKQLYRQMTLASMSNYPATAGLEDKLNLMDNMDGPVSLSDMQKQQYLNNPIQYVSTMSVMACLHGTISINIGLQAYDMHSSDVLFLKSGIICEVRKMSPDAEFFSVTLDEAFYYPIFSKYDMSVLQLALIHRPVCNLDAKRMEECTAIYRLLKKHLLEFSDSLFQVDILKGYLQALLFNIYEVYQQQDMLLSGAGKPNRQQELFNRFLELLQRKFRTERNISYYAKELCVTPTYLSRVVLAQSGHTASEHIDIFVITEAKQMIRSRKYTILQISELLNFTSPSFFGRYFKKHIGFSPKAYQSIS